MELLLRGDLMEVPMDDLVTTLRLAIQQQAEREDWISKALATLNRQGMTYDEIAHRVGISRSKANRLAQRHR